MQFQGNGTKPSKMLYRKNASCPLKLIAFLDKPLIAQSKNQDRKKVFSSRSRFRPWRPLSTCLIIIFRGTSVWIHAGYASPSQHPGTIPQSQEMTQRDLAALRTKMGRALTCGTCCRARNACKPGSVEPQTPVGCDKSQCGMQSRYRQLPRR